VSKGFTKDDATDEPLVVPARAPLPEGTANYVTPRGLERLKAELADLAAQRARAQARAADDPDASREASILATRAGELEVRIDAAVLVDPRTQVHDVARFGASVTIETAAGETHRYRIVGVDEANADEGRIAFTSPLARALLGKRVGDTAIVRTPRGDDELEVTVITYEDDERVVSSSSSRTPEDPR
jgi:transcription elongation factor GreB